MHNLSSMICPTPFPVATPESQKESTMLRPAILSAILFSAILPFAAPARAADPRLPKYVELSFTPSCFTLSPDGKSLAALLPDRSPSDPAHLALVDLTNLSIIFDKTLSFPASFVALDNTQIYVASMDGPSILALSRKDASEFKHVTSPGHIDKFLLVSNKLLVQASRGSGPLYSQHFTLPDLATVTPLPVPNRAGDLTFPTRYSDAWLDQGAVFDADFNKPLFAIYASPIVRIKTPAPSDPVRHEVAIAPWNTSLESGFLEHYKSRIATLPRARDNKILQAIPALASIVNANADQRLVEQLVIRDLLSAKNTQTITFYSEPLEGLHINYGERPRGEPGAFIQESAGVLVVQVASRFVPFAIKDLSTDLPTPLYFDHTPAPISADPVKPTVLNLAAKGGKPPITYSLATETLWLDIDKSTGKVTFDPDRALVAATDTLVPLIHSPDDKKLVPAARPASWQDSIAKFRAAAVPQFKRLLNRDPVGIPIAIPIVVTATDSSQATTTRETTLIVDFPESTLLPRLQLRQPPSPPTRPKP